MVQHIMVWQQILLSGNFNESREKKLGVSYDLDFDATPLSPEAHRATTVYLMDKDIDELVQLRYKEAEIICKDLLKIPVPPLNHDKPTQLARVGAARSKQVHFEDLSDEEKDVTTDKDKDEVFDEFSVIGAVAASAARDTGRYSALCDDYEGILAEARSVLPIVPQAGCSIRLEAKPQASEGPMLVMSEVTLHSEIVDEHGKISVDLILKLRHRLQSGTNVKSECMVCLDPKFALRQATDILDSEGNVQKKKMSTQEASQWTRVVQVLGRDVDKDKKARELRWQTVAKGLKAAVAANGQC